VARNVVTLSALSWLALPLALGFVVFGSSSCIQIGPDSNDGGADGSGADTTTHTLGEQCSAIAQEYCERTDDCALQEDVQYCESQGTANCCGSHCTDTSTIDENAIAGCVADLRSADCDTIAAILGGNQDALPSRCQKVFGD
jgi:hypothetical protein